MQLLWLRHLQTADPGATLPGGDAGLTPPRGTARAMPWAGSGTRCACGCAAAARGPGAGGDGGVLVTGRLVRPGASGTPTPAENRLTAVQRLRPPPVPLRPGAGAGLGAIPPGEVTGADGSLLRVSHSHKAARVAPRLPASPRTCQVRVVAGKEFGDLFLVLCMGLRLFAPESVPMIVPRSGSGKTAAVGHHCSCDNPHPFSSRLQRWLRRAEPPWHRRSAVGC